MEDKQRLLTAAQTAARIGGDVLMKYFRSDVEIRSKSASGGKSYDLVSDADVESEQAIFAYLREQFPSHAFRGEESGGETPVDAAAVWIVDPLDGTNNFAHQIPHFAVSVAFYHRGEPVVGVVWNPARDDWFIASDGGGATHNGSAVRVSEHRSLAEALIGCGFFYDRGEMMRCTLGAVEDFFGQQIHGIRRFGTAALDLCAVGCGQFGGFFEYQLAPWDFAAGRLFVEQAGGQLSTATGGELPLEKSSVLASNGHLHAAMLEITARHAPQPS